MTWSSVYWMLSGAVIYGATDLLVRAHLWPWYQRLKTPRVGSLAPEPEEQYGHPYPPVSRTVEMLPEPPAGYAWEVITEDLENSDGHSVFLVVKYINLLDIATPIETHRSNLTWWSRGEITWIEYYRRDRFKEYRYREVFEGPILKWANRIVDQQTARGIKSKGEYRMKGA